MKYLFIALAALAATVQAGGCAYPGSCEKLETLGQPNLVSKMKPDSPDDPWTITSPCDWEHPVPQLRNRIWQEVEFDKANACQDFEKWKPYGGSGWTIRLGNGTHAIPDANEKGMVCTLKIYTLPGCVDVDGTGKKNSEVYRGMLDTKGLSKQSQCWSRNLRVKGQSAEIQCVKPEEEFVCPPSRFNIGCGATDWVPPRPTAQMTAAPSSGGGN